MLTEFLKLYIACAQVIGVEYLVELCAKDCGACAIGLKPDVQGSRRKQHSCQNRNLAVRKQSIGEYLVSSAGKTLVDILAHEIATEKNIELEYGDKFEQIVDELAIDGTCEIIFLDEKNNTETLQGLSEYLNIVTVKQQEVHHGHKRGIMLCRMCIRDFVRTPDDADHFSGNNATAANITLTRHGKNLTFVNIKMCACCEKLNSLQSRFIDVREPSSIVSGKVETRSARYKAHMSVHSHPHDMSNAELYQNGTTRRPEKVAETTWHGRWQDSLKECLQAGEDHRGIFEEVIIEIFRGDATGFENLYYKFPLEVAVKIARDDSPSWE